jgi:photosystem II stability/assembly factor-like uncharacterized protein
MNTIKKLVLATSALFVSYAQAQYTWEEIILPDSVEVNMIAFDSTGKQYIATNEGVYYSENGNNWDQTSLTDYESYICINENNTIYSGMAYLCRSFDGGINWDSLFYSSSGGIMSICTKGDSTIFIGTWGGIFRSLDSGQSWSHVLDTYNSEVFNDIVCDSIGNFYTGSISFDGTLNPGGIYRSNNYGASWVLIGLEYHFVSAIEINSSDVIFAGTRGHWYNGGGGVFKSIDNGFNWDTMYHNNLVTCITMNEFDNIAIGCSSQGLAPGGVFVSYDDGLSWEDITNNLPSRDIYKLKFGTDNHLYAITIYDFRLFKTDIPVVIKETPKHLNYNRIRVYPNPAHSYLNIQINDGHMYSISILDAIGKNLSGIKEKKSNNNEIVRFEIANMKSGLYFIYFIDENGRSSFCRFIKY